MCAPELNFLDYGLPHFQTCPLLSVRGRRVGMRGLDLHLNTYLYAAALILFLVVNPHWVQPSPPYPHRIDNQNVPL